MIEDTEALVCVDIRYRQQLGVKKYGTTVAGNTLTQRQWLQHAYEECLDQAVYLKRLMQEMDAAEEEARHIPMTPAQHAKRRAIMHELVPHLNHLFGMEFRKHNNTGDGQ